MSLCPRCKKNERRAPKGPYCKPCGKIWEQAWRKRNAKRIVVRRKARYKKKRKELIAAAHKWNQEHPERHAASTARWGIAHPKRLQESWRKAALRKRNKRRELLKRFGHRCGICYRTDRLLVIDHNHNTGFIRGALCRPCNAALGVFKDDPILLRSAISYLANSEAKIA